MSTGINLLVIEDKPADFRLIVRHLEQRGLAARCHCVAGLEELEAAIAQGGWDAVLSDYSVPKLDFPQTLGLLQAQHPDLPVILVSGSIGEEQAVELLKHGVWDFVLKENLTRLVPAIERSLREAAERRERRRAEAALRESEDRYRSLAETAFDWVWEVDAQGRYTYASPRVWDMLGYPPEEVLGRTPFDLMPADEAQRVKVLFEEIAAARQPLVMLENTHRHRDGRLVVLETSGLPILSPEGTLLGYRGTDRDITERKRVDASHARLVMAVEQAAETTVITDAAGVILYANPAFEKTTGYHREEAIGQNPRLLKSGKHDAEFYRQMWATLTAGEVWRGQVINKRKDGTFYEEDASISPVLDAAGKVVNYVAVKRDVTEQKKLEAQFLRAQRLESIGTLAGGVAHDLNNAIAPIMMGVELLRTQYPTESQILDTMQACAQRSADMVRQLLTFAKGAEGVRVAVTPIHLVKELQQIMKGTFPKSIQVAVKCDPKLPPVLGDPTQLHQVLLNLCVNARDAMPHGGTLTLEAQRQEVDAAYASSIPDAKPGNYVVLRVRDTGTGIPPEMLERIFDPFFTTKDPDKGTGLGLSTVMGIVKGHGGFLQVDSKPGQGSTFTAYLPTGAAGSDTELVAKTTVEFRGQGETILCVDDEPAVRQMARAVLQRLNFRPLTATDGTDGLIQAAQHRTELRAIITDLNMPHMDGRAFVRALRRMLPDLPIVVASGRMEDAVAEEFKTLGVTSRLDKPFTEVQLAEVLKKVLAPKGTAD